MPKSLCYKLSFGDLFLSFDDSLPGYYSHYVFCESCSLLVELSLVFLFRRSVDGFSINIGRDTEPAFGCAIK